MVAEIIKGMPIPAMKRKGAAPKYPWTTIQPGQAFKFDLGVSFAGARSMASQHMAGAMGKAKFVVRETAEGLFCWRVDGTEYELQHGNAAQTVAPADYKPTHATRAELVTDGPHMPIRAEKADPI